MLNFSEFKLVKCKTVFKYKIGYKNITIENLYRKHIL